MNNTQFDLYLSNVNENPDKLKALIGQLLEDELIKYENGNLTYIGDVKVSEFKDEISLLKLQVNNLEEQADFLESEISYLKLERDND